MRRHRQFLTAMAAMVLSLTACSLVGGPPASIGNSPAADGAAPDGPATGGASATPGAAASVTADPALRDRLPERIRSAGVIRVASNIPYPPWEMYTEVGGEQPTGIDYDLSQALAAKLGVRATFDQTPFDAMIPALLADKADIVMAGLFDTPKRRQSLDFVDYAQDGYSLLVAKGNPEGLKDVTDLSGKTVAVQSSTSEEPAINKLSERLKAAGKPGVTVVRFPGDSEAFLAIRSGKAVARVQATSAAAYAAKTFDNGNAFELVQAPSITKEFGGGMEGIGVPKSDPELLKAIQMALQALMDDGTYQKILAKYGVESIALTKAEINKGTVL
ncbi:transporter substrate-binding domain-containing protein [Nonomuraea phyllanthi]|uniref:Transporter substrate-binding domain-containing protein n=1 Tax=Nonomuraea phyllanthi TaxID=2219224 RepID=A0A5C4WDG8_9ACTN|nr:ABC transporter substrate-binding protein [Nonomuraea phyllanthi]KAB8192997.1 transporter substrate-binding domain-containing protein [Nonomuraea phyllanthi]QFY11142.1 transporter substrate-binding domain-containing protein [Nonomuraea phyllanthi]